MAAKILKIFSLSDYQIKAGFEGFMFPDHDQQPMEDYLLNGWLPGGFLEAMLANDVHRACANADQVNKKMIWAVAYWITTCAPQGSYGSYDLVTAWCKDIGGRRTAFADPLKKKFMWDTLSH